MLAVFGHLLQIAPGLALVAGPAGVEGAPFLGAGGEEPVALGQEEQVRLVQAEGYQNRVAPGLAVVAGAQQIGRAGRRTELDESFQAGQDRAAVDRHVQGVVTVAADLAKGRGPVQGGVVEQGVVGPGAAAIAGVHDPGIDAFHFRDPRPLLVVTALPVVGQDEGPVPGHAKSGVAIVPLAVCHGEGRLPGLTTVARADHVQAALDPHVAGSAPEHHQDFLAAQGDDHREVALAADHVVDGGVGELADVDGVVCHDILSCLVRVGEKDGQAGLSTGFYQAILRRSSKRCRPASWATWYAALNSSGVRRRLSSR